MIFLITVWLFLLGLYTIFILIKYYLVIKKLKKENPIKNDRLKDNYGVFIAIPCLREQNCIEDTINYFRTITDLPIIIITSEKENYEYDYNSELVTTKEIVEQKIINKFTDVFLIHYPYISGYMADQLNYMLNNLHMIKGFNKDKNWYMALYNADSRPSKKTFNHIISAINDGNMVIQQYSYCMKNYNHLNYLVKGFALYQSNFELKVGLYNSYLKLNNMYRYVVGHGLVINVSLLKKLGNFNTDFWCEDIYLTMFLKFKNIPIKPILQLENIENADTLSKIIKQNAVWFNTTNKYYKIYKDIKNKNKKTTFSGLLGCINEFRCAANWLCFPILLFAVLSLAIISKKFIFVCFILLVYSFYIYVNYFITLKTINYFENKGYKLNLKQYFSLFLATLISNFGPVYSIIDKTNKKYKTER